MASPNVLSKECKEALEALGRPLRFATSSDFSNLPKIRDLELTLHQMAKRALLLVSDSVVQAEITTFIAEIPSDSSSDFERKSALERLSERLERILTGEGAQISSSGQAPAAPTKADAQEDTSNVEPLFAPKKKKREVQTPLSPQRSKVKKSPVTKSARLDSPIQYLKGVGPRFAHLLDARGMKTVEDLLRFLPRRYERRLASSSISGLQEGTIATVEGVIATSGSRMMRGKRTLDVAIRDTTGVLQLRWFHAPGKAFHSRFKNGLTVRVSGRVSFFAGRSQMVHPEIHFVDENEAASDEPVETKQDEVVPVYSEIEGIRPALFRTIVERAMEAAPQLEECVPEYLRDAHRLPDLGESISALHFPPEGIDPVILEQRTSPWHRRLIYEELLLLQLTVLRRKVQTQSEKAQAIFFEDPLDELALELFSFELTQAQRRVLHDIQADLSREVPMQRLLQGDVGSGKTAVAFSAAAGVARAGLQTAIMAPTEILAEQHARSGLKALGEAGVRVALLTGATSTANRREILEQLASGEIQVIFGTHALIQSGVEYSRLGMVVVDEQHRFGVMQRAKLIELGKKSIGKAPHTLVMTATPIPRTLALTVYGDLDVSVLDELPPGRQTIATKVLTHHQRAQVYQRIRKAVAEGRQAYVVYPLVEESDKEAMQHVHDATSAAEEL
ncbi:ATP-dependent DNA helicase RecG, partial [Myxococcota bacterium]|nr:ATP-dependent DNA helicase RecG [Myxococcota bacterium]